MRIKEFEYNKNGDITKRVVLPLCIYETYEDCIDFGKLEENEIREIISIQMSYEASLKPYTKKAFRRFSKDKMNIISENKFNIDDDDNLSIDKIKGYIQK